MEAFMLRIISLLLLSALISVQTHAATGTGLKQAFDEFRYSVNVEWDQQDLTYYETARERLETRIGEAMANGATTEQVIEVAIAQIPDAKLAAEMRQSAQLLQAGKLSASDARELLMKSLEAQGSRGASWTGVGSFLMNVVYFTLAMLGLIVYAIAYDSGYMCREVNVCQEDFWGNVYCRMECR
jgi:hypothetical protein